MKLEDPLREWVLENYDNSDILESDYFSVNEIRIDPLHTYEYREVDQPQYTKCFQFEDRCGNIVVAAYIESIGEFKTGYRVEGTNSLIFQPERLEGGEQLVKPCPDDRKVGTVYKILIDEIIPNYLLNKKPNKLYFNPVSDVRSRLVDILINKITKQYPQLTTKQHYLIHK